MGVVKVSFSKEEEENVRSVVSIPVCENSRTHTSTKYLDKDNM